MRFRIVFLGGVYPPFKQLKHNFLLIFGLFWAFLVFLFTCLVFNILHYMYNVMQQNGCFPLLVRVSGLFAIPPVIIPYFPLLIPCLAFPCLSFLPSFLPFFAFLCLSFGFLGWVNGQTWADQTWQTRTDRTDRTEPNQTDRTNRTNRTNKMGLYLRLNQLIYLFGTLHRFVCLGRTEAKKRGFEPPFYLIVFNF